MRLAVAVGGTDAGKSGIGAYLREILPRIAEGVAARGGDLVAVGAREDLAAYDDVLGDAERVVAGDRFRAPLASALWHLVAAGDAGRRAGADVLLLPAANRRATLRSPIPTVAVVHDLAQLHVPGKYDALRMAYVKHVVVRAIGTATQLAAVSHATRKDVEDATGVARDRVHVVPNGVDVARFSPLAGDDARVREAREALGLPGPYLLYVSRLEHPGKNHLRLLDAFAASAASKTHVLAIAGKDWGAGPLIAERIRALGITDRVRLLSYVPDALLPAVIAAADAVAMVGLREGFGLPVLEALACGRPVIIARAGALPEVAGGLGVDCDPLEVSSITAAIDRAVGDQPLRARARDEGPRHAAARGWEVTAQSLLALCDQAKGRA